MNHLLTRWTVAGLGVAMLTVTGCSKDSDSAAKSEGAGVDIAAVTDAATETAKANTDAAEAATAKAAADPAVVAKLVAADALDGTVDGVVTRCAGCRLGMDGSEKHALTVGEHKMHFCSDGCRSTFSKDVSKGILALSIPSGD